ncbi:hypothetical protein NQ314_011391 [Rhamnusium bicolor]|uniref:HAT C-terminal dimerisation domain-containing protein n=1 Tax=Rhamnusium bicolor TaxID=1586634 RepID=A0AAV8XIB3_9CUCU|nr:hypothetical protein NQ314_011391 [Rhamnusium bicolor]
MSLCGSWNEYLETLAAMEENLSEKAAVRAEASGIKQLNRFEFAFMCVFWEAILERFHKTNLKLQSIDIDSSDVALLYASLIDFVQSLRNENMFNTYVSKATEFAEESYEYDRQRKCKLFPGDFREDEIVLTGREKLKVDSFYAILDKIIVELKKRSTAYENIFSKFSLFFLMKECSQETLIQKTNCLREYYKDDLEMSFPTECLHFSELLKGSDLKNEKYSVIDLLSLLREKNLQTVFPNIDIALRIFVSMAVSVCSAERSFSALKRIK